MACVSADGTLTASGRAILEAVRAAHYGGGRRRPACRCTGCAAGCARWPPPGRSRSQAGSARAPA